MAELWKDGFDHYGSGVDAISRMLQGAWAGVDGDVNQIELVTPPFGARTGEWCLTVGSQTGTRHIRRTLDGTKTTLIVSLGFAVNSLPDVPGRSYVAVFFDNVNPTSDPIATLYVTVDGGLQLVDGTAGSVLATTAGPVISAGTWHHIEFEITRDASAGALELRVDETVVINASSLALGANDFALIGFGRFGSSSNSISYWDDIIVRDNSGSVNNDFQGDLRVATLFPIADATPQGWTAQTRQNIGSGVLDLRSRVDSAMIVSDVTNDVLWGADDFTIEGSVRFNDALTDGQFVQLAGVWRTDTNQRSYRLGVERVGSEYSLVFESSTDGTLGTIQRHSFPWPSFQLSRWFAVAVSRSGGFNRLFIDGQLMGLPQADTRTYHASTDRLSIGAQLNDQNIVDNTSVPGFMDTVRLTRVGRYTANYVVSTDPFPTDVGSDPSYGMVEFLANFDQEDQQDQSMNGLTTQFVNNAAVVFPADKNGAYNVIDDTTPLDDTFIEAAFVSATSTLSLTANPLDTETVVIGSTTYTFNTTLGAANSVLIGADTDESLTNLQAAVNQEAGEGTTYGTGTVQNTQVTLSKVATEPSAIATARTPGAAANTIDTTTTVTGATWSSATLTGGADIPAAATFNVSRLPPEVTGINSVSLVARVFKADSGSAQVELSWGGETGALDSGAAVPLTLTPSYIENVFERDPATLGGITPNTLLNARYQINRTQ